MFEVMSSTIKKLNDEYVEYKYFVDLLMLHTGAGYKETATLLLNQNFNQSINIYSIDNAFRIKKLEDKKFLEGMLEDLISDNFFDDYDESSNINRLPQKAIEEHYRECLLKKSDLLEISYIKELGLSLSGEEYQKDIVELYGYRNHELIRYRNEERRESCYCFKAIRTQNKLNLDEIACMMSSECYCHIHNIEGHADYSCCSEEFWSCRNFLQEEYESGSLKSDIEDELFSNKYIQRYLYKNGFTIEGHNQGLAVPAIKPLSKNNITYLSQQLIDVQENIVQPTIKSDSSEAINSVTPIERACLPKHPKDNTLHTDLGKHQKLLITYDVFTLNQIICLILNYPPNSSSSDHEFISYLHWIDEEVRSGNLVFSNEADNVDARNIDAQQVKVWLARNNYVYKDFNDNIPADPVAQVRQLTAQIAQLIAENTELNKQLNNAHFAIEAAKTSQPSDDDKELAYNSQTKVACMLYAILQENNYDLSPPMGKGLANDLIVNASQVHGTPVTKNFVADWLKRANQAKINCSKK